MGRAGKMAPGDFPLYLTVAMHRAFEQPESWQDIAGCAGKTELRNERDRAYTLIKRYTEFPLWEPGIARALKIEKRWHFAFKSQQRGAELWLMVSYCEKAMPIYIKFT